MWVLQRMKLNILSEEFSRCRDEINHEQNKKKDHKSLR